MWAAACLNALSEGPSYVLIAVVEILSCMHDSLSWAEHCALPWLALLVRRISPPLHHPNAQPAMMWHLKVCMVRQAGPPTSHLSIFAQHCNGHGRL